MSEKLSSAIAQLRHLYPQLCRVSLGLADGLLSPQIRKLEEAQRDYEELVSLVRALGEELTAVGMPAGDRTVVLENVRELIRMAKGKKKQIFVFGSNLAGIHGAGSARAARELHGAQLGCGYGPTGNAYAIPTKDRDIRTLPLSRIKPHVDDFIEYAQTHPHLEFNVVKIGCGLAGYKEEEIAPLFRDAPHNVNLPEGWRKL